MQAQDVINASSQDMRSVLSNTGTDANVFLPWIDQVQKDILHGSIYSSLLANVFSFTTAIGTSVYNLNLPARKIHLLYDRTFDRVINKLPSAVADPQAQNGMPESLLTPVASSEWPTFYKFLAPTQIVIFPAPQKAPFLGVLEAHYEGYVGDVVATNQVLFMPDDGIDLLVAGVNMKAAQFLKLTGEAQLWQAVYEAKKGVA